MFDEEVSLIRRQPARIAVATDATLLWTLHTNSA
jgi:hypothetical protein